MGTKQATYLPLRILKTFRSGENSLRDLAEKHGWIQNDVTRAEVLDYVLWEKYMRREEGNTRYKALHRNLARISRMPDPVTMATHAGKTVNHDVEIKDHLSMIDAILMWGEAKQVYKLNGDFIGELIRTGNLELPVSAINRLPVADLYIDLSDAVELDPVKGVFVHAMQDPVSPQCAMYMVTEDETVFSFYSCLDYNENALAKVDDGCVPNTPFVAFNYTGDDIRAKNYEQDPRVSIVLAVYQVLMFLEAKNRDIEESPVTKKTYRPFMTVRDKFSEVRIWDVGVRYGAAIRLSKQAVEKEIKKAETAEENDGSVNPRKTVSKRKPVRPHVRCAHWQRYRVGKGRTETRVNWIAPVFVCGRKEIPCVIHELDNQKT